MGVQSLQLGWTSGGGVLRGDGEVMVRVRVLLPLPAARPLSLPALAALASCTAAALARVYGGCPCQGVCLESSLGECLRQVGDR